MILEELVKISKDLNENANLFKKDCIKILTYLENLKNIVIKLEDSILLEHVNVLLDNFNDFCKKTNQNLLTVSDAINIYVKSTHGNMDNYAQEINRINAKLQSSIDLLK